MVSYFYKKNTKKMKFPITLFDKHILLHSNENIILVDTGSPVTIHSENQITFCNQTFDCSKEYFGVTVEHLSDMLGSPITTLMGTDILSEFIVVYDYENQMIEFKSHENQLEGNIVEITQNMGLPMIDLILQGEQVKVFIDTGAKISYIDKKFTQDFESQGTLEDFNPMIGEFSTESYTLDADFEGNTFSVLFGNLPEMFQAILSLSGVAGVIGYDFFNHFNVSMDLKNNLLSYKK